MVSKFTVDSQGILGFLTAINSRITLVSNKRSPLKNFPDFQEEIGEEQKKRK